MKFETKFTLSKSGQTIGDVVWHWYLERHNGVREVKARFEGEPHVLQLLHNAFHKAVADKITYTVLPWDGIRGVVEEPELYTEQLIAALEYAGFDSFPDDSELMRQISGTGHHIDGLCY